MRREAPDSTNERTMAEVPAILVVDDHMIVRNALRRTLREWRVLTASSSAAALLIAEESNPSAAVVDLGLPGEDGFQLVSALAERNMKVVVFSGTDDYATVAHAIAAGAAGFVGKARHEGELILALQSVLQGGRYFPDEYADISGAFPPSLSALTYAERRVLGLIGEGLPNKVIAEKLARSPRTVEAQRASISAKLGVGPGDLVAFAVALRIGSLTTDR